MPMILKRTIVPSVSLAAGLLPLLIVAAANMGRDLWWDEITSLGTYALVSFGQTVSTFYDTNNHVLFNLVYNCYTRLLGERDLYALIDKVPLLRMLQLVIAAATACYLYALARKFFDATTVLIAPLILTTTVPFLNFAVQLRGYTLSALLLTMVLFHGWSYRRKKGCGHLAAAALASGALLYTIPSNAYFYLSFLIIAIVNLVVKSRARGGVQPALRYLANDADLHLAAALLCGGLLATAAYLPIIGRLLTDRFVTAHPADRFHVLAAVFPNVIFYFVSFRFALPVLLVAGIQWQNVRGIFTKGIIGSKMAEACGLFCLPFIIAFVRNDDAYDRTFVPLVPVFSLIMGAGISLFIHKIKKWKYLPQICLVLLFCYSGCTVFMELQKNQAVLHEKLRTGVSEQTIYRNYYLSDIFNPHRVIKSLARECAKRPAPIILVYEIDRLAVQALLEKYRLDAYAIAQFDTVPHYFKRSPGPSFFARIVALDGKSRTTEISPIFGAWREEYARFGEFTSVFNYVYGKTQKIGYYIVTSSPEKIEVLTARYFNDCTLSKVPIPSSYLSVYFIHK